jgi:hypothetical protein
MRRSTFSLIVLFWVQAYLLGPELLKLPALVMHYVEHCTEEEELGFMTFLDLHYADPDHQENGDDDHEQLPYHHHHGAVDCCGAPVYLAQSIRSLVVPASSLPPVGPLPTEEELLSGHTRGLIQPPRVLA